MIIRGHPWCMFAGPRAFDPARCDEDALLERFGTWTLGYSQLKWGQLQHADVPALLAAWKSLLDRIEAAFVEARDARHPDLRDELAHAITALLAVMIDYTYVDDRWFEPFETVLGWYCEFAGIAGENLDEHIARLFDASFESWVLPPDGGQDAARAIGRGLAEVAGPSDALAAWLASRGARVDALPGIRPVTSDPHVRYLDEVDTALERADTMRIALDACRAAETLSVEQLVRWQQIVLDGPAPLRTTDAFAKRGREHYPMLPDLGDRLAAVLREATDPATPLVERATRAYLDICFLHPFVDGNARAARLVLDHVVGHAGYGFHAIAPFIGVAWQANVNPLVHASRVLGVLLGPRSWA